MLLEIGIFGSHLIWLLRTRTLRKNSAAEGKTFDDVMTEHRALGVFFKFAERLSRKEKEALALRTAEEGRESQDEGAKTQSPGVGEESLSTTPKEEVKVER